MSYGSAVGTVLGALVAGLTVIMFTSPTRENPSAAQLHPTSKTIIEIEGWSLCTSDPAVAQLDPEYAKGLKAIEAKAWDAAIKALESAALRDTRNADIQDYLGYAYWNLQQSGAAFEHYQKALRLNARHRGAHQHIGEAYLMVGDIANARQRLVALERICLIPCREYEDLKKLIAESHNSGNFKTAKTLGLEILPWPPAHMDKVVK
jgi:tetratricopeptide (TPR) repeat protein